MFQRNRPLDLVIPSEQEVQCIKELARILKIADSPAKLVTANGEQIPIPESVYQALCKVVHTMASGQAVAVVPEEQELTTQQAANFLNVSRPYLIKLLEQGEIPYIQVGSHRRVNFDDLKKYKQQRDAERSKFFQQLIEMTEEAGLYDD
jgi:excisionase family DNA binding protein